MVARIMVGTDVGGFQRTDQIDDLGKVVVVREDEEEHPDMRRSSHQPDAGAGDDAVIGLREQAVERRPEAVFGDVPIRMRRHVEPAVAGTDDVAIAEHDFDAAEIVEMAAERAGAAAFLDRIAKHAAIWRTCGRRHHQAYRRVS